MIRAKWFRPNESVAAPVPEALAPEPDSDPQQADPVAAEPELQPEPESEAPEEGTPEQLGLDPAGEPEPVPRPPAANPYRTDQKRRHWLMAYVD